MANSFSQFSNSGNSINSCKGCIEKRKELSTPEHNCHSVCEEYLKQKEKLEQIKQAKKSEANTLVMWSDARRKRFANKSKK